MANNLALELLNKHLESFDLEAPLYIRDENDLMTSLGCKSNNAIVFLPKSKPLIDMTLALVSGIVERNGIIVLVGEKDAGIESAKKIYEKNIGPVEQKIVGNHSALYVGKNKRLGADKKVEDYLTYSKLTWENIQLDIANLPGVFSAGELDEGTKLLLEHIPYNKKKVLDVGSGSGVMGSIYKKKSPGSEITMTDWSKLAVLASKKTLEINKLDSQVIESDVFDNIKGKFDLIFTNPPFHKGIDTDYSFIEKFSRGIKSHLNPDGEVYVVANSFLPYKEILEKYIGSTQISEDNKKFKVYLSN
jgi:16S rRNA (guanine1207-N2)-methyltransferase